jgi:hypothetical protein
LPKAADSLAHAELNELLRRAHEGDTTVLPHLRDCLSRTEVWRAYGDLGAHVRRAWIAHIAGHDLVVQEAIQSKLSALERELSGQQATRIEHLVIERILATWLQLHHAELWTTQSFDKPKLAEYWARRQARAERAHLRALGALATLRRLLPVTASTASSIDCEADTPHISTTPCVDQSDDDSPFRIVDRPGA